MVRSLVRNTNLSGLIFQDLNLAAFSFHNSKLASTEFINCNLEGAEFDGCYFKETLLSGNSVLAGASVKGAAFESIRTDKKQLFDQKEIQKFFFEKTQVPISEVDTPCQGAINLKRVLEKLVRKGKGFNIPRNFVAATKLGGGTQAVDVMNAAIKRGYLVQDNDRVKVRINLYEEVLNYTKAFSVTRGIKEILDDTCTDGRIGCSHT